MFIVIPILCINIGIDNLEFCNQPKEYDTTQVQQEVNRFVQERDNGNQFSPRDSQEDTRDD